MRFGAHTNGTSCEFMMQDIMKEWLIEKELRFIDEFYVSEVSRRPDFLIVRGHTLINIEAKCNNLDEMMRQIKDNAAFCNYSFAYIPDYCMTSRDFKRQFVNSGVGLIVFNYRHKILTEVLEAHQNQNVNREIQTNIVHRINKELIRKKQSFQIDTQQTINHTTQ